MRHLSLSLLAILALIATACGSSTGSASSPSSPAASTAATASSAGASVAASGGGAKCSKADSSATPAVNVTIKDFKFSPQPVQAKVGQVIGWKNDDAAGHTATLADDSCGTDTIASGSTGSLVFNVAGTYTYKCAIHPTQMKDFTIVVS